MNKKNVMVKYFDNEIVDMDSIKWDNDWIKEKIKNMKIFLDKDNSTKIFKFLDMHDLYLSCNNRTINICSLKTPSVYFRIFLNHYQNKEYYCVKFNNFFISDVYSNLGELIDYLYTEEFGNFMIKFKKIIGCLEFIYNNETNLGVLCNNIQLIQTNSILNKMNKNLFFSKMSLEEEKNKIVKTNVELSIKMSDLVKQISNLDQEIIQLKSQIKILESKPYVKLNNELLREKNNILKSRNLILIEKRNLQTENQDLRAENIHLKTENELLENKLKTSTEDYKIQINILRNGIEQLQEKIDKLTLENRNMRTITVLQNPDTKPSREIDFRQNNCYSQIFERSEKPSRVLPYDQGSDNKRHSGFRN